MPSSTAAEANHLNGGLLSEAPPGQGTKRKRGTRACDRCHQNACRCEPGISGVPCSRCEEQDVDCTYTRPLKRRGPPVRGARRMSEAAVAAAAGDDGTTPPSAAPRAEPTSETGFEDVVEPKVIEGLVDVYYHTIYPVKPVFHWPTFYAQVQQQLYRSDWGVFVVTMAVCALTAGRLYCGVPLPKHLQLSDVRARAAALSAQCYTAAVEAMPRGIAGASDYYQAMRASFLLASVCLQDGQMSSAISHSSDYTALSTMHGFHSEAKWPAHLSEIEKQERRRLFWGAYQQDQYLAVNFGLPSRQREAKTTVLYPAEVCDDEDVTASVVRCRPESVSFLRGWNYCTNLYRLFENMDAQMRAWREVEEEEPGGTLNAFLWRALRQPVAHHLADGLHLIATLHRDLPSELKTVKAMTGDPRADRHGFTAANILFTTTNLKMLLVGAEANPSVHLRCAIASELLDELGAVPPGWLNAASTGSLHHIAHVGHVLGSTISDRAPLSSWSYLQVRNILLVLADFLEKLEASRGPAPAATPASPFGEKVRAQIRRIDRCMQQARQARAQLKPGAPGFVPLGQGVLTRRNSPPPGAMNDDSDRGNNNNNDNNSNNVNGVACVGHGTLGQHDELQQLSPPPSVSSATCGAGGHQQGQISTAPSIMTVPPSVLRLTRLLGAETCPLGGGPAALGGASNDFGFVDCTFDISPRQPALPNPGGPDLVFPPLSNPPLSANYFDGWPDML